LGDKRVGENCSEELNLTGEQKNGRKGPFTFIRRGTSNRPYYLQGRHKHYMLKRKAVEPEVKIQKPKEEKKKKKNPVHTTAWNRQGGNVDH